MTVMVGNNSGGLVHMLAGRHPGRIGWLISPGTTFKEPREWLPYAIDNGKFTTFSTGREWDEGAFFELLDRCRLSRWKPRWVLCPDEVGDRERTLWLWRQFEPRLRRYGWPLAFALQDGMTPKDVPEGAEVAFVGGKTQWKWRNLAFLAAALPRVHVGRVNMAHRLEYCERLGVESVDGTGYFRGGETSWKANALVDFLEGHRSQQVDYLQETNKAHI